MQISKNSVVVVHYTLSDEDGKVIDSSDESGPVTYVHGRDEVFPGLETALEGKAAGATESFSVSPDEGFGEHDSKRIVTLPRDRFEVEPTEGQFVLAQVGPGRPLPLQVLSVAGDKVVLDGNHPLAGRTITFTVKVLDVRAASPEEAVTGYPLQ